MSRVRWIAVIAGLVVTVAVLAVLVRDGRQASDDPSPPPSSAAVAPAGIVPSASTSGSAAASSPPPTASDAPVSPAPTSTPRPTRRPTATGDPRLLYAEFLLRLDQDRATVVRLNQALQSATEAGDRPAARRASIDILDFADAEQDWLREHPPATCYADAHAAADRMLEAYAGTADAFITWADAGEGLAGLAALGRALDAAGIAGDALTTLGRELEATTCLT